jgi:hypothetical protein
VSKKLASKYQLFQTIDGGSMATRKFRDGEAQLDDLAEDLERMDRDRAGQSGDIDGLSPARFTSSLSPKERLSRLLVPTSDQAPSTIKILP